MDESLSDDTSLKDENKQYELVHHNSDEEIAEIKISKRRFGNIYKWGS